MLQRIEAISMTHVDDPRVVKFAFDRAQRLVADGIPNYPVANLMRRHDVYGILSVDLRRMEGVLPRMTFHQGLRQLSLDQELIGPYLDQLDAQLTAGAEVSGAVVPFRSSEWGMRMELVARVEPASRIGDLSTVTWVVKDGSRADRLAGRVEDQENG